MTEKGVVEGRVYFSFTVSKKEVGKCYQFSLMPPIFHTVTWKEKTDSVYRLDFARLFGAHVRMHRSYSSDCHGSPRLQTCDWPSGANARYGKVPNSISPSSPESMSADATFQSHPKKSKYGCFAYKKAICAYMPFFFDGLVTVANVNNKKAKIEKASH